tara:strand:- start:264 stop:770 length:507 start_codon:yes stop_codon:yes gene_type:complete
LTSENKRIDLVEIGILAKPHGLGGEIKLILHSQNSDLILKTNKVYIDKAPYEISKVKKISNGVLVKFLFRNDRTSIESLLKKKVFVDKKIIPDPPKGENYYFELIGSKVSYQNKIIGSLIEIVETKANNIYVIRKIDGNEILIPKTESFIKKFNKDKKILEVILPEVL